MSWLVWFAIVTVAISNLESSEVKEFPNSLHVTAGNNSVKEDKKTLVDPNGYILFCPCMGEEWEGLRAHYVIMCTRA